MAEDHTRALSDVLDRLDTSAEGESIAIADLIENLGPNSFASLMFVFSLISTSPASAIPGVTTTVAGIVFFIVAQMIIGRDSVWLPVIITRREISKARLRSGIGWLRNPVRFVERFLTARLSFFFHRPWIWLPLILILGLTLLMPFMEVIPASGSVASAVIALFAAGLLTRDGGLTMLALSLLLVVPVSVWYFGFFA